MLVALVDAARFSCKELFATFMIGLFLGFPLCTIETYARCG
jgi:hypothetical protein